MHEAKVTDLANFRQQTELVSDAVSYSQQHTQNNRSWEIRQTATNTRNNSHPNCTVTPTRSATHDNGKNCKIPARHTQCRNSHKIGHWAAKCRSTENIEKRHHYVNTNNTPQCFEQVSIMLKMRFHRHLLAAQESSCLHPRQSRHRCTR